MLKITALPNTYQFSKDIIFRHKRIEFSRTSGNPIYRSPEKGIENFE